MPNLQSRHQLTQHDLIDLLNFELAAYEECGGCHVTAVELAPLPYGGCNWRGAKIEAPDGLDAQKQRIIEQVLAETREQFNVRPPLRLPSQRSAVTGFANPASSAACGRSGSSRPPR